MIELAQIQGSVVIERPDLMEGLTLAFEQLMRPFVPEGE